MCVLLLFFLVTSMTTESTSWCKFTQLMTNHVFSNVNRNKFVSVVNCNCMPYEIRRNH